MNTQALNTVAKIVFDSAVEFLAQKHNVTVEQIVAECLTNPNGKVVAQLSKLIVSGADEASKLALVQRACA